MPKIILRPRQNKNDHGGADAASVPALVVLDDDERPHTFLFWFELGYTTPDVVVVVLRAHTFPFWFVVVCIVMERVKMPVVPTSLTRFVVVCIHLLPSKLVAVSLKNLKAGILAWLHRTCPQENRLCTWYGNQLTPVLRVVLRPRYSCQGMQCSHIHLLRE